MPVNQLTGDAPVSVDGITIDAPGLSGEVVVETGAGAARRGMGDQVPDQIRLAVRRHGGRARRTIRIESPSDAEAGAKGETRGLEATPVDGRRGRPSAMRIAVPRPRPGRAQVLLSRDEHGIVTWHLQQAPSGRDISPEGVQVFEVDRAPSGPATRTFGLPKILQVISFPLVKAGGKLIEFKVREWDRDKHPDRVSAYGPDRSLTALDDAAWARLSKGRCLLFIHGTFDTVAGCFTRLPDATLAELNHRYGGRMIGFDHPTLADSPIDNARAFFQIVGDHHLDVDIVCHSRGGLVTRAIAERPSDLATMGPNVRVGHVRPGRLDDERLVARRHRPLERADRPADDDALVRAGARRRRRARVRLRARAVARGRGRSRPRRPRCDGSDAPVPQGGQRAPDARAGWLVPGDPLRL